ncbi:MAG TPA: vWA domain-containing protein [Pyrinomonadaceae bacterium]|nr:vWA domain-containing protein [Pyrinomonadaceae bacterium]
MTRSHDVAGEYGALLESLEIPVGPLRRGSVRTPEWEVLNDIRTHFGVPGGIDTRAPLVGYLSSNVPLDDFFSFMGFLIKPFARMVVEIYDFLSRFERTAASAQAVTEIRVGSRTAFPVNLKFMPRELLKMLTEASDKAWDFDALGSLHNFLPMIRSVARCDGSYGDKRCRPDCFQHCREGVASVVKDVESILLADEKVAAAASAPPAGSPSAGPTAAEAETVVGKARLRSPLREAFRSFLDAYAEAGVSPYKAASDCLPGQARGVPPPELYTQKYIRQVQDVLARAATEVRVLREEVKEFLKLPYWRRRNDLYEVWVLAKVCGLFPARRVQLCNLDAKGRWRIPGNNQGRIDEPVLRLSAPSGNYRVYTGLNLKGYHYPEEKIRGIRGGMPDWLFCRETDAFDFGQLNDEAERFEGQGVVPEFIVECKAGASYGLLETVEKTMKARYLPLLRTERGRAVLVNYRPFYLPEKLDKSPTYRDSIRHRYKQILALDVLAPESSDAEAEFLKAVGDTFGLGVDAGKSGDGPLDLLLVVDTTGSMHRHLGHIRSGWVACVDAIAGKHRDVRFGVVCVGDHGPDDYVLQLSPLAGGADSVAFLAGVPVSNGNDTPEAYEDALHALVASPWRDAAGKLVVFVGDAYPHPTDECPVKFDWENELSLLKGLGVVIHGVRILGRPDWEFPEADRESATFFNRICSETGGKCVEIESGRDALDAVLDCVGVS